MAMKESLSQLPAQSGCKLDVMIAEIQGAGEKVQWIKSSAPHLKTGLDP